MILSEKKKFSSCFVKLGRFCEYLFREVGNKQNIIKVKAEFDQSPTRKIEYYNQLIKYISSPNTLDFVIKW